MARDEPEPPYCVLRGEQETEEDKNLLDTDLRMPIATSIDEDDQAIREERQRGRRQGRQDNIRGAILFSPSSPLKRRQKAAPSVHRSIQLEAALNGRSIERTLLAGSKRMTTIQKQAPLPSAPPPPPVYV